MLVKPSRRPESGSLVVLWWALLGCMSSREGLGRSVAGVRGPKGEETIESRLNRTLLAAVSSRSSRDPRLLAACWNGCGGVVSG